MLRSLPSLLAAAAAFFLAVVPAGAGAFDCAARLSAGETAICASPVLSQLDQRMSRFYGWLWAALEEPDRIALRGEQRRFLADRSACAEDVICIRSAYLARIEALSASLKRITDIGIAPAARRAIASVPASRS